MMEIRGSCHCGALRLAFFTAHAAADLPLRACQCGFCRRHGALNTSDPQGRLEVTAEESALVRYRQGLGITDFLLCGRCGVYVAAIMADDGNQALLGTVNVRVLEAGFPQGVAPMDYGAEDVGERRARRRQRWSPAALRIVDRLPGGNAGPIS